MYEWGYIVNSVLAKMDLTQDEALTMNIIEKMYIYANEAMTQICSTVKPKRDFYIVNVYENATCNNGVLTVDGITYQDLKLQNDGTIINNNDEIIMHKINSVITVDDPLFIGFGDDISTIETVDDWGDRWLEEAHNDVLLRKGYNKFICMEPGTYSISYNKRWYKFLPSMDLDTFIDVPADVLDCLPSYIASQLYKMEDEYKSSIYRNEYEMFLARIDDTDYNTTSTFKIKGDW